MGPNGGRLRLNRRRASAALLDSEGFFGIRLESIGGLGAHLAGQILAEAAVLRQGLNGAHFSSYGSEKKGSPVKSYIRLGPADRQLRTSSPVDRPHVVAIFHEALAADAGIIAGWDPAAGGAVVVNSAAPAEELRRKLAFPGGTLGVIDALRIAIEEGGRVNTVMLGAIARVAPLLELQAIEETIRATFERKYPHLVETNLRTFRRGYEELALHSFEAAIAPPRPAQPPAPAFGYLEAPLGGLILNPGNSVLRDLSASRQGFIPAFDAAACVHCGLCDLVCPDLCFVWGEEQGADGTPLIRLRGIDYQYCKGCLKCIDACPTTALTALREEEGYAQAHTVPLFPSLKDEAPPAGRGGPRANGAKGDA